MRNIHLYITKSCVNVDPLTSSTHWKVYDKGSKWFFRVTDSVSCSGHELLHWKFLVFYLIITNFTKKLNLCLMTCAGVNSIGQLENSALNFYLCAKYSKEKSHLIAKNFTDIAYFVQVTNLELWTNPETRWTMRSAMARIKRRWLLKAGQNGSETDHLIPRLQIILWDFKSSTASMRKKVYPIFLFLNWLVFWLSYSLSCLCMWKVDDVSVQINLSHAAQVTKSGAHQALCVCTRWRTWHAEWVHVDLLCAHSTQTHSARDQFTPWQPQPTSQISRLAGKKSFTCRMNFYTKQCLSHLLWKI